MIDNPNIVSDEKNQKHKSAAAEVSDPPRVGKTVTLRAAAMALAKVAPGKKGETISVGKLLTGLKAGDVQAGFHCCTEPLIWVSIPKAYWINVATDDFRAISFKSGSKTRTGSYKVKLKAFTKEYISAYLRAVTNNGEQLSSEVAVEALNKAIALLESTFEIEISQENWDRYLATQAAMRPHSTVAIESNVSSGSGRETYAGWKALNATLAAYLVANDIRSNEDQKIEAVAAKVYEL